MKKDTPAGLDIPGGVPHLATMAFALVVCAASLVILWLAAEPWLAARRRQRVRAQPFPAAWREILERRVPYVQRLPARLRAQLEDHVKVFIAGKQFFGCDGMHIDDEVRVTIAAQACLLLLERRGDVFPNLGQVLVYPSAFMVERVRAEPSGVLQEQRHALSGESWTHGQVVLSWEDVLEGAAHPDDGRNVVIHEFAHQLDQVKGYANGAPWLGKRERYARWSRVMNDAFLALRAQAGSGLPSLLSAYGATSPAEFFAVASEVFFEQPAALATLHPELYAELSSLYRIDPVRW
jgi:Mlc titration factor MtfA (ptsG expression regulator)